MFVFWWGGGGRSLAKGVEWDSYRWAGDASPMFNEKFLADCTQKEEKFWRGSLT